jgi:hypothetical protein
MLDFGFNSPLLLNAIKTLFELFSRIDQMSGSIKNRFKRLEFVTQTTGNLSFLRCKNVFQDFYFNAGPGSWKPDGLIV